VSAKSFIAKQFLKAKNDFRNKMLLEKEREITIKKKDKRDVEQTGRFSST